MLCKILSLNSNADTDAAADTNTDAEMLMPRFPNSLISLCLNTDVIYLEKERLLTFSNS